MKKHLFAILLIVITCLAWAFAWPHLPDTIATHWSGGKVDGYSSKLYGMLSMVGIMIVLYIFLSLVRQLHLSLLCPTISQQRKNYLYKLYSLSLSLSLLSI